jgi:arylsulfatase A-like enzyme
VTSSAIAPATYTGASVPSILTGLYPSTHRCWEFDDRLPNPPALLKRRHSYRADNIWTHLDGDEKPPLRQTHAGSNGDLSELQQPFVYIEHDKGGHSPYGHSFADCSTPEFFSDVDPDDISELYRDSVKSSADRFREVLLTLEKQDRLEDTLVVFTSDHGELLGEPDYGGLYGHGRPMVPETVRIPVVFMGAGLPTGESVDWVLSGTDIAPTALSALGEPQSNTDGVDLWASQPENRCVRSEYWLQKSIRGRTFDVYNACSVWNETGGVVYNRGRLSTRIAYAAWAHLNAQPQARIIRSQMSPTRAWNLLNVYAPERVEYGNSVKQGVESAESVVFKRREPSAKYYTDDQLRALGYVE